MGFFSDTPNKLLLTEFDPMHIGAIAFFTICIALIIAFKNIILNAKYEKLLRYSITFLAIAFEMSFHIWTALTQDATFLKDFLPLDLCAISLYLCIALMLTKSKWVFKLVYFYSLGAMVSLLVPDLGGYGVDHFRYYHYFYVHGFIMLTSMYFVFVHNYKIVLKDLIRATVLLIFIAGFVMAVDLVVGANYMFLMHKPHVSSPLDLFGPWPEYVYALVFITIAVFIVAYLPWIFVNLRKKPKSLDAEDNKKMAA